ncbi:LamG-like jellyroll fold domain-containing protein [Flavobacterium sp.]
MSLSSQISLNQWHHIIFTYDNSYMKLYLDGVLSFTKSNIYSNKHIK